MKLIPPSQAMAARTCRKFINAGIGGLSLEWGAIVV
jgi:hypothetical protein